MWTIADYQRTHSSNQISASGEISQWLCHDDSITKVNGIGIIVIINFNSLNPW